MVEPYYKDKWVTLFCGDNLAVLPSLTEQSFDACVTDGPYGITMMGKAWDYDVPTVAQWQAVWRVLKPGAFLLAFFGTRTYHRGVVNIEDAGFEIRDCLQWLYAQGYPKSLSVSKQLDKMAGAERELIGEGPHASRRPRAEVKAVNTYHDGVGNYKSSLLTAPATDAAKQWDGWGTGLKPAAEMICLARRPLSEKTVAENIVRWGVGALNIDASRVGPHDPDLNRLSRANKQPKRESQVIPTTEASVSQQQLGRWPSNVLLEDAGEVKNLFPHTDSGSAARFFFCAKADNRNRGNYDVPPAPLFGLPEESFRNTHPTVKPLDLCRYLITLVTPPGGRVLDPFAGSASSGVAAKKYGLPCHVVLIEREQESCDIAVERLKKNL